MSRTARPNISRPPKDGPAYIVASVSIVHPRISKWDAFFGVTDAYGSTAAVQAGVPATAASGGVRTQSAGGSLHAVRAAHSFAPAMMMSKTGSLIS
jgi:hypothetical protein